MNRFQQIKAELAEALEPGQQRDELQGQKKALLAQKLLKGEQDPENLDIDLESVATDLREYRDKLKTFLNSNLQAEIAQSLQNAGKTVSLVEKLEQDTNTALDESRDLETLAEHLQSQKIARVADTEEERIKELGRKLQRIDQRSQRVETLVGRLQQMLDDSGIELENLNQEIEKRVTAVNRILEKAGEKTGGKNRQERDSLEHNLGMARDYFKRVYGDGLRETEFLAFNRISQARSYLENNREEMDRLEQGFKQAIKTLEQKPNRARCVSIGTESVTALSIIYIPNGFTEGFEELFHAINRINSSYDEETYVPIATFLGGLWARQQGYLQGNPDRKKLVEDAVDHGSFTRQGYSFPAEQVRDEYKGREVTAKLLEMFVRRGMERSEIEGVAVEIYEEILETEESAPEIISDYLSEKDSEKTEKVDRFAAELLEEEEKLIRAGGKGKESLTRDIQQLEHLYRYRKFEETKLGRIESRLRSGDLEEAKEASEELAEENKQVESQTGFSPESLEKDLEEEIEISKTLYRFFSRVRKLRENGVDPETLFEAMARNSSMDEESALELFRSLRKDYSDVREGIMKAAKLARLEHKVEKHEYDEIRKIEDESAKIWNEATSKDRDHLEAIHQNLQTVGFDLSEVNPSQGTKGSKTSSTPGPEEDGNPWIVSLSDIESWPSFLEQSLKLVNQRYKNIVDFTQEGPEWSGNNYHLIINGDLIQYGRHGKSEEAKKLIDMLRRIVETAESGSEKGKHPVQFTVGNHDPNLYFKDAQCYPSQKGMNAVKSKDFVKTYRNWVGDDIVKMAIPGYNFTYVHAGQAHEWTKAEIKRANQALKNIDYEYSGNLPSAPDENNLREKKTQELDTSGLRERAVIDSLDLRSKEELKSLLNLNDSDFNDRAPFTHGYKGDLQTEMDKKEALKVLENGFNLGLSRIKFKDIDENDFHTRYAKLFGPGETGRSGGKNIHAGMIWARDNIVKHGSPQIVGHTGHDVPTRKGNIIVENTSAKSGKPSVVVETPKNVFSLSEDSSGEISMNDL